ncbi:uncharacterized protein LOC117341830 [Pecten maximus]|uniref:uncharacterized protein LOC117341830 n=1 Tax=Pecten maximus TaxID=6579 RepID=UPI001458A3A0|nr:uncharacterized protein LOC117341830 [Pecten maximus]
MLVSLLCQYRCNTLAIFPHQKPKFGNMDNTSRLGIILWIYLSICVQMTFAEKSISTAKLHPIRSSYDNEFKFGSISKLWRPYTVNSLHEDYEPTMEIYRHYQLLNVSSISSMEININIELQTKVELLVEEWPGDHAQFELVSYSPYSWETEPDIKMSHVVTETGQAQHIMLQVGSRFSHTQLPGVTGGLITVVLLLLSIALLCLGERIQHRKKKRKRGNTVGEPSQPAQDHRSVQPTPISVMLPPVWGPDHHPRDKDTPHRRINSGDSQGHGSENKEDSNSSLLKVSVLWLRDWNHFTMF